ncbi:MAG: bifunctional folylpolyglutamate synthase/dihydrofolate synthase [Thermoclostridium sp.]|nr:bifunctional folylpolyglutamate synthase/dihydrofolate synthase [Thermoclostridium sp.]
MDYQQAIDYIHSLEQFGSKPGLERIRALTQRLGNPQDRLKFIHIAGTNGKGSTAAFIASVTSAAGYRTGRYTSPFIVRFNERINLDGKDISDEELAEYVTRVKGVIDEMISQGLEHPTEFEVITALAFLYYYEKKCDLVILEVGLGGRFDATNIIAAALVSVITKIEMDHMAILGDTLAKIAYEKAGIIKDNGRVVTYPQEQSALDTIEQVCNNQKATLYRVNPAELIDVKLKKGRLSFIHPRLGSFKTPIVGVHQVYNAAVALKTIEVLVEMGYSLPDEKVRMGFQNASWPGRFELLQTHPDFYIDGGHNPDGIRSFVETFKAIYPGRKAIIIFGVMRDKEYETMVAELSEIASRFIAVTPCTPRALPAENLAQVMVKYCQFVEISVTIKEAVEKSLKLSSADDIIASLGSLYYIGQVRTLVRARPKN